MSRAHPCQANAYLTPPGSQGFALHSDSHDVIVFQTYGAKEWEVHDDAGAHQVMMTPGTSMYLPTGTPHMARTQATASLHVTVGINRYVWRDLVQKVIDPVLASKDLDGALPAELFHDKHALAEALRAKVEEVAAALTGADVDGVLRRFETSFATGRQPVLGGGLLDRLAVDSIDAGTRIRRRPGSSMTLRDAGDTVELLLGDRLVAVPSRIKGVVEGLAGRDGDFPAGDIEGLDEAGSLVLARRLVREGFLEVVQ
ncbi:JmjC domain-containing protein [Tessaracoccus sp. MC1679]|uniref:JmjC domain-containing protein n=1 Tax=Tessaracoccus sp. MC1679 TaxID=2760313 RepID=UPI00351CAC5E